MASHMERTLKALRDQDCLCDIVERFCHNKFVGGHGHRSDLYHLFDVLALCPHRKSIIGVQVCGADFAAHYRKITQEYAANARLWLECNGTIEIWSWRKLLVKRGGKLRTWQSRVKEIVFEDLEVEELEAV